MKTKLSHHPGKPQNEILMKSYWILCSTHDTSSSFLDIFESERTRRKAKGAPTDEEQDLLRAMLAFATSGLDSMVKQLVKDTLPRIVRKDKGASEMFRSYIEKRMQRDDKLDHKFLAAVLTSRYPQGELIADLIDALGSTSLQSKDQLLKVAAFFNIESKAIMSNPQFVKDIFDSRNQISHEMDVLFDQTNRSRRSRRKEDMIRYTNEIFNVADSFLSQVDAKLGVPSPTRTASSIGSPHEEFVAEPSS
jgi:hypothetical protein